MTLLSVLKFLGETIVYGTIVFTVGFILGGIIFQIIWTHPAISMKSLGVGTLLFVIYSIQQFRGTSEYTVEHQEEAILEN